MGWKSEKEKKIEEGEEKKSKRNIELGKIEKIGLKEERKGRKKIRLIEEKLIEKVNKGLELRKRRGNGKKRILIDNRRRKLRRKEKEFKIRGIEEKIGEIIEEGKEWIDDIDIRKNLMKSKDKEGEGRVNKKIEDGEVRKLEKKGGKKRKRSWRGIKRKVDGMEGKIEMEENKDMEKKIIIGLKSKVWEKELKNILSMIESNERIDKGGEERGVKKREKKGGFKMWGRNRKEIGDRVGSNWENKSKRNKVELGGIKMKKNLKKRVKKEENREIGKRGIEDKRSINIISEEEENGKEREG